MKEVWKMDEEPMQGEEIRLLAIVRESHASTG
jgi:hypothetical protein